VHSGLWDADFGCYPFEVALIETTYLLLNNQIHGWSFISKSGTPNLTLSNTDAIILDVKTIARVACQTDPLKARRSACLTTLSVTTLK
jgi:hypothetical protein